MSSAPSCCLLACFVVAGVLFYFGVCFEGAVFREGRAGKPLVEL